jgi:hypothetical protein
MLPQWIGRRLSTGEATSSRTGQRRGYALPMSFGARSCRSAQTGRASASVTRITPHTFEFWMPSRASRPAVVELLAAFADVMRSRGWRWYVFGAQAVVAYGRPRMTADVDVTVDLAGDSQPDLIRALTQSGFEERIELDSAFVRRSHLLPLAHSATGVPVDVVVSQPGLQEEFLACSVPVDIGGVTVPLVSVEHLVAMKVLAGRRKDLEDVRGVLLERWESVDFAEIDRVLTVLEDALETATLKPRLKRIVRRVREEMG